MSNIVVIQGSLYNMEKLEAIRRFARELGLSPLIALIRNERPREPVVNAPGPSDQLRQSRSPMHIPALLEAIDWGDTLIVNRHKRREEQSQFLRFVEGWIIFWVKHSGENEIPLYTVARITPQGLLTWYNHQKEIIGKRQAMSTTLRSFLEKLVFEDQPPQLVIIERNIEHFARVIFHMGWDGTPPNTPEGT